MGMAEVLLVDDDADIRGMLVFTFEDYGFAIREAGDGLQALDALNEHPPDVMVLDLMMPNLDGFGVLAEMRAQGLASGTRVVVLTAMADERNVIRGFELGADEYVTKPFDPDGLARIVERLAASPRPAHR